MAKAAGAFTNAQADIDAQRRALLSAVAQRGDQGLAEMQAQNKAAQAMRTQAIQGIAQNAGGTSGRGALTSQLQGQAGQTADLFSADAAASARGLGGAMQTIAGINDNYMRQAAAAVPVSEQVTDRQVNTIRQQNEQAAADRANQIKLQELQIAAAERDAAKQDEGKPADVNQVGMLTGWSAEEQTSMMLNRGYATLQATLNNAQDQGMNAGQALSALQQANKELEKEYGHGFGNTLDFVWAQYGNKFAGFDPGYFTAGRAERTGEAGRAKAARDAAAAAAAAARTPAAPDPRAVARLQAQQRAIASEKLRTQGGARPRPPRGGVVGDYRKDVRDERNEFSRFDARSSEQRDLYGKGWQWVIRLPDGTKVLSKSKDRVVDPRPVPRTPAALGGDPKYRWES